MIFYRILHVNWVNFRWITKSGHPDTLVPGGFSLCSSQTKSNCKAATTSRVESMRENYSEAYLTKSLLSKNVDVAYKI